MTREEFTVIVESTKAVVLSAIEKNLYSRFYHAIDDVVQETYIRAYKSLIKKSFRGDSSISSWLFVIARNESIRMNVKLEKEEKKFLKSVEKYKEDDIHNTDPDPVYIEELKEAIIQLPEKHRDVMELALQGMSEKEIALKLNLKKGTVKSRLSRGRDNIKRIMVNY